MGDGDVVGPLLHCAFVQLHDTMALVARQVVVMTRRAVPPTRAVAVLHGVDDAGICQRTERAVHRRQTDRRIVTRELGVQRLRRHVAAAVHECGQDADPLVGRPHPASPELDASHVVVTCHASTVPPCAAYMRTVIIYCMIALLLAFVAAAGFLVASLLVESVLGTSRLFHHVSVVVAAGILLGVTLADLIPETLEQLDGTAATLWIASGFLMLFVVEMLTSGHTHHHEPHGPGAHAHSHAPVDSHAHSHAPARATPTAVDDPSCVPTHAVLPFLIGLGIHNLADGIVIGASHEVSDAAATSVAVGILVHQLPVGLSFAAVLLASGVSRSRAMRDSLLIAALIPLGAAVVLLAPDLSGSTLGALIGIAAGALLYIATGHLLPEAHSEERRPGIAAAFTISLVGTILFVGALHERTEGDEHTEDGSAEHAEVSDDDHA